MRKSLLVTLFFPPDEGGMQDYLYSIARRLPKDKIVVLSEPFAGDKEFDAKQGFKVYRKRLLLRLKFMKPRWLSLILASLKIAKKEKVQLIQCGQLYPTGLAGLWAKKRLNIPYLVYVHGIDLLQPLKIGISAFGGSAVGGKKRLVRAILYNAERIITNSSFTKEEILKLGDYSAKTMVLNPGIDLEKIEAIPQEEAKAKLGLQDKKVILTVGRLIERKGVDMTIKAMLKVLERVKDAVYVIVGRGPYEDRLKELAKKLNLEDKVKFVGFVEDGKLPLYYSSCDVFCMPNREIKEKGDVEGFGIVFLEAGGYGKPVIGGKSGGTEDAIVDSQTGLLVDPENQEEIAQALIKLLTNKELANKFGVQGRERVEKEFNWDKLIEKLKAVL